MRRGLLNFGGDPALHVTWAMVELGFGNLPEADRLLQRVRECHPSNLVAKYATAWMNIERGEPKTALPFLLNVVRKFPDYPGALGTLASVLLPGPSYREVLAYLHHTIRPKTYLEIGVEAGATLRLAAAAPLTVGVDPNLTSLRRDAAIKHAKLYSCTSDEFFRSQTLDSVYADQPLGSGSIDGMHRYEFALRDFGNVETWANLSTIVVIHDLTC